MAACSFTCGCLSTIPSSTFPLTADPDPGFAFTDFVVLAFLTVDVFLAVFLTAFFIVVSYASSHRRNAIPFARSLARCFLHAFLDRFLGRRFLCLLRCFL